MKNTIRIFAALLLLLSLSACALAASEVVYLNQDDLFDFRPGSTYHVTDLFENFKNVVPGDTLTQTITVRNASQSDARIYIQAAPEAYVTTEQKDFLDQLRLTVQSGNTTIFNAPAGESAQLTEPKLLGFFAKHPRGKVDLTVTLRVPIELGNEYMAQVGVIPWTFIVEEIPNDGTPDTGDWYENSAWLALAGVLVLAILFVLLLMKKRRTAE